MKKFDISFLLINIILCCLVWIEFFTGGYGRGLTFYNVLIARLWAFIAAISIFYSIISFNIEKKIRKTNIILLIYSLITIGVVLFVIIAGV
jgi:hypothetical protein